MAPNVSSYYDVVTKPKTVGLSGKNAILTAKIKKPVHMETISVTNSTEFGQHSLSSSIDQFSNAKFDQRLFGGTSIKVGQNENSVEKEITN